MRIVLAEIKMGHALLHHTIQRSLLGSQSFRTVSFNIALNSQMLSFCRQPWNLSCREGWWVVGQASAMASCLVQAAWGCSEGEGAGHAGDDIGTSRLLYDALEWLTLRASCPMRATVEASAAAGLWLLLSGMPKKCASAITVVCPIVTCTCNQCCCLTSP